MCVQSRLQQTSASGDQEQLPESSWPPFFSIQPPNLTHYLNSSLFFPVAPPANCHRLIWVRKNTLESFEQAIQVFLSVLWFYPKNITAPYMNFLKAGRVKFLQTAFGLKPNAVWFWFYSRACVKISNSHLRQCYATSGEYTAWLKYGNISLK